MSNDVKDRGLTGAILDELWPILGGSHTAASVWTEIEEALSPVIARHQLQREAVLEQAAAKALKHAANKIDEMMPPEQQSNGWKLGFYRMRKNAKDLLLGHARAYWASALEGGSAVGAGRLDHPLRHPAEASLTTPATAVSRDDQALFDDICAKMEEVVAPLPGIPDAPGQHAGTRAIEPSDGDKR